LEPGQLRCRASGPEVAPGRHLASSRSSIDYRRPPDPWILQVLQFLRDELAGYLAPGSASSPRYCSPNWYKFLYVPHHLVYRGCSRGADKGDLEPFRVPCLCQSLLATRGGADYPLPRDRRGPGPN